jgi:hypothetical protein
MFSGPHADSTFKGMLDTDFVGLGSVYQADDPGELLVRPFPGKYDALRETLEELRGAGALTFFEEFL